MDEIDGRIIEALKENGRATVSEVSRRVCLSVPAVAERIRKLEQTGVIEKYTVKINRNLTGFNLLAFVLVNIAGSDNIENFRDRIVRERCVLECHHIAGPNDYLLKVLVRSTGELESFLSQTLKKIDGVAASHTIISLSALKEEVNV
ncbi:MAG: Lrp/AsnC family transcriptional regulator [bacterium]|nr:Lrp/AsnC family transcriptional regulator [bacterium]